MGDMSDYFEDFPKENPGNYVGNTFDPAGAKATREWEAKLAADQAKLDAEIAEMIRKHSKPSPQTKK